MNTQGLFFCGMLLTGDTSTDGWWWESLLLWLCRLLWSWALFTAMLLRHEHGIINWNILLRAQIKKDNVQICYEKQEKWILILKPCVTTYICNSKYLLFLSAYQEIYWNFDVYSNFSFSLMIHLVFSFCIVSNSSQQLAHCLLKFICTYLYTFTILSLVCYIWYCIECHKTKSKERLLMVIYNTFYYSSLLLTLSHDIIYHEKHGNHFHNQFIHMYIQCLLILIFIYILWYWCFIIYFTTCPWPRK